MRSTTALLTLALAGTALTQSGVASADIFRCMQADGTPLFTNVPDEPRCRLHLKLHKEPSAVARIVEERATVRYSNVDRSRYDVHVQAAARAHGVDAALIHAVISAESGYNRFARSPKGARGLMQLIPETGARYGATNLLDPRQNIDAGTRYLKDLIAMFGNDLRLVLAAYNAGEGAVLRYGNIPPYAETRQYVPKVLAYYKRYSKASATSGVHVHKT
ncbi:MAG: lytic transglycosylase domain-containing protein [Betaproteobacteria bacterium]